MSTEPPTDLRASTIAAWQSMGDAGARDPISWLWAASHSWHGAEILWARHLEARQAVADPGRADTVLAERSADLMIIRTVAFLGGVALEALLKGLAIRHDQSLLDRPGFYTHDLEQLARLSATHVSDTERPLLGKLTDAVTWWGRYPVTRWDTPAKRAGFTRGLRVNADGSIDGASLPGVMSDREWATLHALVNRLGNELDARGSAGDAPSGSSP